MKNKPITYVLMAIVISIWGIIFYRFFSGRDSDSTIEVNTYKDKSKLIKSKPLSEDSFILHKYFRDPFLGTINEPRKKSYLPVSKSNDKVQINWDFIKYIGTVKKSKGKNEVVLISINGKDLSTKQGEEIEEVKILKCLKDSIKVKFKGKIHYIKRLDN